MTDVLKTFARTDLGAAKWLADAYGGDLRFCVGRGWLEWTGTRWKENAAAGVQYVQRLVRKVYKRAAAATDPRERQELGDFAVKLESAARIKAVVFLAENSSALRAEADAFDADPWLFNTMTGVVELRTGRLRDHDPRDLMMKQSPVEYDGMAKAPRFEKFLGEIFPNDPALIAYVQRTLGMMLTGDIREQHLWFFHGDGGNGKSTLVDAVTTLVMGDYAGVAPQTLLVESKSQEHPTELADLQGKRLIVGTEPKNGAKLRTALIKRLTGDSRIKGRRMRQDFVEFLRTCKFLLYSNKKPRVEEDTPAIWQRIRLVPFDAKFRGTPRDDKKLLDKLKEESAGILNWLIAGCLEWQKNGLGDPASVTKATEEYRAESDAMRDFLEERCKIGDGRKVLKMELYTAYRAHALESGDGNILTKNEFGQRIGKLTGIGDGRVHGGARVWTGIGLLGDPLNDRTLTRERKTRNTG